MSHTAESATAWRDLGAGTESRLLRVVEWAALLYVVCASAGIFGFVDVLMFGHAYRTTSESLFAQVLWPLAYLWCAALMLTCYRELWRAALRVWWLLLFPALAALSVLWSIDPKATVDGAIRIAATTAIGLYIGVRFDVGDQVRAIFWLLLAAIGASVLAALASVDFALMFDGTARGVFHHKNTLGSRAALLIVAGLALSLAGWRPLVVGIGIALGCTALVLSKSAAGLALGLAALAATPLALSLRGGGLVLLLRLAAVGAVVSLAALVIVGLRIDPVTDFLDAVGRDATLTGRVILWEAALHHIAEHPLLGVGFNAFWDAGLDWQTFSVLDELGYVLHFHNAYIEIAVQLGALGLLAAAIALWGYGRAALLALRARTADVPLWPVLFGVLATALAVVEYELFVKHNLFHILLVAIPTAVLTSRAAVEPERAGTGSGAGPAYAHTMEAEQTETL
jgi:exopolysaccharide production protein ExoQ